MVHDVPLQDGVINPFGNVPAVPDKRISPNRNVSASVALVRNALIIYE